MRANINALMYELDTVKLPKPSSFIQAVRMGKVTDGMFEKHGAAMALQWVLGYENGARAEQKKVDEEEELA